MRACIGRIGDIQSLLNAVVDQRFAKAIEEAQMVDSLVASLEKPALKELGRQQPFLGVPFSTKVGRGVFLKKAISITFSSFCSRIVLNVYIYSCTVL